MTKIEPIHVENLSMPRGHYSYAVSANGFVFIAGLLPTTPEGRQMTGEPFEAQTKQVLSNLDTILRASKTDSSKLVQVRVYLPNIENWPLFNQLYAAWIGEAKPARCVVPVPKLHYDLEIEIEAVAVQ